MRHPFVHELFCRNAEAFPEHIAIIQGDRQVTYQDLHCLSDNIARQLTESGVAAQSTVALLMDDRILMIAGILATLKAGGAFIPVPSELPDARIGLMFDQCRSSVLLTEPQIMERAGLLCASRSQGTQILSVNFPGASGGDAESLAAIDRGPDDFCYVY